MYHSPQLDLSRFKNIGDDFASLSLKDLVAARDQYHLYLMRHPNVIATAVGRYRIRKTDSWPGARKEHYGRGVRRLDNSEVRPYSWPSILVFVESWQEPKKFAKNPQAMVPSTLIMPDGRNVPVCVIEAPKQIETEIAARNIRYPLNNIGPGNPVIAEVQGREYVATIGCLVSDGHRIYALTNRHVTGDEGEVVWGRIDGQTERIGVTAAKQLTRLPLSAVYPNFAVQDTFVNLDVGLIDLDDLSRWTTQVRGLGTMGSMADFSGPNLSLSLIGCHVRGVGAAGGDMRGEIHGLFYRYKTTGGFEYVADLFIGPRTSDYGGKGAPPAFATLPGDSGTLWLLETATHDKTDGSASARKTGGEAKAEFLPLALQWGRNMLFSAEGAPPQSFVLATLLSRVCALLEVDPVRAWNIDQPDTWGAIGHFAIAARTQVALSSRFPKLTALMGNNATIISHDDATILDGDFTGMGKEDFVALADVPDFFWKPRVAKQGHTRPLEGPNHFADMDQQGPDGKTLLDLTEDDSFIDPDRWQEFYETVRDILSGDPISKLHRGLLPFRVWQLFDAMVEHASAGEADKFVCAAGVLTHYVGDACQPLHISYLHDGDPNRPVEHTFSKGKKEGETETRPLGQGVHSAYEDKMVFDHRDAILTGLKATPKVAKSEMITSGFDAARKTIELMRSTFKAIPPMDLVQTYVDAGGGKAASDAMWKAFGKKTISVMQDGTHLLAVLWESAWATGDGEKNVKTTRALTQDEAMAIVSDPDFVPSMTVDQIGSILKHP